MINYATASRRENNIFFGSHSISGASCFVCVLTRIHKLQYIQIHTLRIICQMLAWPIIMPRARYDSVRNATASIIFTTCASRFDCWFYRVATMLSFFLSNLIDIRKYLYLPRYSFSRLLCSLRDLFYMSQRHTLLSVQKGVQYSIVYPNWFHCSRR